METAVEFRNITKKFPGVVANDDVSFRVRKGSIHALVGENGAGKTTLMNILYGLYKQDSGTIYINGSESDIHEPEDAIKHRIGMVHQHFMLVQRLPVVSNIILGAEIRKGAFIDRKRAVKRVEALSERYRLQIDPSALIADISVGMQQRVEILKCLYREADTFVLDEPTGVLTPQEITELLEILRELSGSGKTIIFITHKLDEVKRACDEVTILRHGRVTAAERPVSNLTTKDMARLMVGKEVELYENPREEPYGRPLLEIEKLNLYDERKVHRLKDITLTVKENQILGIAGVDGNGQKELVQVITGSVLADSGSMRLLGRDMTTAGVKTARNRGIAHIPEDRHKLGLVMEFSLEENLVFGLHRKNTFAKNGVILKGERRKFVKRIIRTFDIRPADPDLEARQFSGGNQQKAIIARELSLEPKLVVASQPTRGLDIGAGQFVWKSLLEVKKQGGGVLLVSLDLDEIYALSDLIAVVFNGKVMGVVEPGKVGREELGLMMLGIGEGSDGTKN